jgi:hypothetical protein
MLFQKTIKWRILKNSYSTFLIIKNRNIMKLYTIYTDSHKNLYENYFLKTIPNEFEIISTKVDQECATGEFYSDGWGKTCYRKVELFYKACLENMGGLFVYSDVDIQFFGKIKDTLIQ